MANWQPVQMPTGGGIDTKTDEKRLPLERVADLQNIVFTDAPGWRLRNGYVALDNRQFGSTDKISTGVALGTRNDELVQFDDEFALSWSPKGERWKQVDRLSAPATTIEPLLDQQINQTEVHTAAIGGIRMTCWIDGSDSLVHYQVTDDTSDTILISDMSISGSSRGMVCGNGNALHVLYYEAASTSLNAITVNIETPTTVSDTELVTDAHTDAVFDIAANVHSGTECFVVYKESSGGDVAAFILRDVGTVKSGAATDLSGANDFDGAIPDFVSINCGTDGTQAIFTICLRATANGYVNQYNGAINSLTGYTASVLTTTVTNIQAISNTQGFVNIWWDTSDSDDWNYYVQANVDQSIGSAFSTATAYRHQSVASKPFIFDGRGYIMTAHASTLQSKYFLMDARGNFSARLLDGIGVGHVAEDVPHVQVSGSQYRLALGIRKRLTIDEVDGTPAAANIFSESGARLVTLDFASNDRYQNVQAGQTLYVNAGFLQQYDGVNVRESGFHLFPENVAASSNDTGSSNLNNGETYNYRVYYEYTNNAGERQRSTGLIVSHTLVATGDGTGTITLEIPTLRHTAVASDVSIVVFRTEGNASVTAGAPFYRVSDPNPANDTGNNRYVLNSTTVDTVSFVDNISDDPSTGTLTNKELDYQNPGELDNVAPPAGNIFGYGKSRLWVCTGTEAHFSKLRFSTDLAEFHDGNFVKVPDEGGDITAVAELNHFVLIFKRDRVYAISGEGPDNLGQGFFNLPRLVTADVGCNRQSSVVRYDKGVMFMSDKGIYQVGQNLDVSYVGASVEDYNDVTITAATAVNDTDEVRFLTSSGRTLVYNYLFNAWTTFTNHNGTASALWGQTYVYIRSDTGRVFQESETAFTDNGSGYGWLVRTAHFSVAGPVGFQRVRHLHMLGEYYSSHDVQVRLNYNNEGFDAKGTYDPTGTNGVSTYGVGNYGAGAYGGTGSANYEMRFNLPRQKCRTVQFEISCIPTVAGRGCEIDAMAVLAATKYGNNKMADGRKFGE